MEFPFERDAMLNNPMPSGLSQADQKAFQSLRLLYQQYYSNMIDKDKARHDKQEIIRANTTEKSDELFLSREAAKLNKRIRDASEEYINNPSLETARKLYNAFYNIPNL
jgi:hypothetical protein